MQEHGRVIAILNPQTGTSPRTGQPWYSQSYVIEIDGRYPRRVVFSLWGYENNLKAALQMGEYIDMCGEVEAHEFQGRWYNELRAYDILKKGRSVIREQVAVVAAPAPSASAAPVVSAPADSVVNQQTNYHGSVPCPPLYAVESARNTPGVGTQSSDNLPFPR